MPETGIPYFPHYSSKALMTWDFYQIVLQHPDVVHHGFQYIDWLFDGKDILFI